MKAVVLAGGQGTRGRPYTEHIPKALFPARGAPLIRHVVGHLLSFPFVDEAVVVADFEGTGSQIRLYMEGSHGGRVRFVQDSQRGTGGDLLCAAPAVRGSGGFVLWFVDNLCALDLSAMRDSFVSSGRAACVAVRSRRREETGFARVRGGLVEEFREKPVLSLPLSECLGVYMMGDEVLSRARKCGPGHVNLSYDVLQPMAAEGKLAAHDIGRSGWLDVESPSVLERRSAEAARIISAMGRGARPRARLSGAGARGSGLSRRAPRAASSGRARRP